MKYLFCLFALLIITSSTMSGQSLKTILEQKMEKLMRDDAQTWKASEYIRSSIYITKATEQPDKLVLSGAFKAKITQWPFRGTRTIKYRALVTILLGEPTITKIWWTQPILDSVYCVGDCG